MEVHGRQSQAPPEPSSGGKSVLEERARPGSDRDTKPSTTSKLWSGPRPGSRALTQGGMSCSLRTLIRMSSNGFSQNTQTTSVLMGTGVLSFVSLCFQ
ncbi:Tryptophan synthase alpha chain [Dissostichus eleginoides]|uniref:Tryptophan synthase alpha chain n=1 Tax=Dissostichus eleginoides TaxID=100907 RepID=A0AAD9BR38_DISEL|nr:Tryptophan synthase alpha chain [Dissostichus eleginoides]